MAICVVCKEECGSGDVQCADVSCDRFIHQLCMKKDMEGKKTRSGKEWKCKECRSQSVSSNSSGVSASNPITMDFLVNVLEGFKKEVFEEFKSVKHEMSDVAKSVQFVSDKLDTSNNMMEEIKRKFEEIQKENEELRSKNSFLTGEVMELRERMRHLEQYSRRNNLEVSGVPSSRDESVPNLVKDIGAALGAPVLESDVAAAHRVPTFRKDREPSLVIQFNNRATRDKWLKKYREMKQLSAQDVHRNFPNRRVFINSHLSPENKQFLAKLKQKCRDIGYSFAWCRDDKFFARKAPGENVTKINSYADIDKLK